MAALTTQQKQDLRAAWCAVISNRRDLFALTRAQLDAAIDATDTFIDSNAAAYNSALPVAARNGLTAAQKAELFHVVATKRFGG